MNWSVVCRDKVGGPTRDQDRSRRVTDNIEECVYCVVDRTFVTVGAIPWSQVQLQTWREVFGFPNATGKQPTIRLEANT
jgi:hypothetical protein